MILPLPAQGAPVKTCAGMDVLNNAADHRAILGQQHQQSGEALEPKHKGADSDTGSLTGHSFFGWPVSVSEGSVSSMDSLPGGEALYSPTDYHASLSRKARPGVHMSESLVLSDDEPAPDLVEHSFGKRRNPSSGMEEGDSAEATPYSRHYFAKFLQEGGPFLLPSIAPSFPPASHALDQATRDLLELGVVSKPKAAPAIFHYSSSSDHSSDAESVSNSFCNSDTHSGMCSVGRGSVAPDHGSTPSEDFPCSRVKFMCSFGGKILPRPVDGTLRYVGGETRIVTVPRDITYTDLMFKMTEFYGNDLTLKYQLPKEELDALVSVSSDEDLENMMEEYDKIEISDQSSRLRVFLFNAAEYDMAPLSEQMGYVRDSEQRYVDAVNGLLEPVPRKQSEGASSSTAQTSAAVENLLDVDPPWVSDHPGAIAAGAVPVALLAPAVSQDVASLIQQVPVALPVVSAPNSSYQYGSPVILSAPLSAPSSPPNAVRSGLVAPPAVADLLFQDPQVPSLDNLAGHLYAGQVPSETGSQDVETYAGTAAPSAGGHDAQFRGVDSRRAPESPPRSNYLPRPSSYGKLADQDRGGRSEHVDGLPSFEFHRLVLQQQQPRQHPLDVQPDTYRRTDLLAHDAVVSTLKGTAAFGPPPQLQPLHFRPGLSGHDGVYWQRDQSLPQPQQQQNEDLYGVPHFHRSISAQQLHQPGSTPSSPRLGYRDVPGRHLGGQQQFHRHYAHADGQYARMLHGYGDQASRPLPASPPRHRDRDHFQPPGDDRAPRQQQQQVPTVAVALAAGPVAPLLNAEAVSPSEQHAGTVLPGTVSQSLYSEVLPRGAVPQYVLVPNPYQEGLVPVHEHQDSGDSRRHILPHGVDAGVVMPPQPHYLLPVQNQRGPLEQPSLHARYADAEWGTQQRGHDDWLRPSGRAWMGQPNYMDESPVYDAGASQSAPSSFSAFLPDDSDVLLSQDPYVTHPRTLRVEDGLHGRSLLAGTGPGFAKARGPLAENSQVLHQLQGRTAENEYQLAASKPLLSPVLGTGGLPVTSPVLVDEQVTGIPLTHATRGTATLLAAGPTVTVAVPVGTVAVPVVNDPFHDPFQVGRVLPIHDERFQNIPGVRGDGVRPATMTGLEGGLDDIAQAVDGMFLHNGSDETITNNYGAPPVAYVHQSALSLGQHSAHTHVVSVATERPRGQAVYKPSPLGVKGSAGDESLSAGKYHLVSLEGQLNYPMGAVDLSNQHDTHHSGAALLAEDMAASVLTSREPPVFDRSEAKSVIAAVDAPMPPATDPSLINLGGLELHTTDQQTETVKRKIGIPTDERGISSLATPVEETVEESKTPIDPEETDDVLSPLEDSAAKAKREAISRGLQTIHNADLEELRELGSGTFGTVYHGKWRGSDVAIKRIKASCFAGRPSEQERLRADFWREACTLSQLHHPNVVAFYGVVPDGPGGTLATVTEYMVNGSMKQVMQKKDRTIDRRKRLLIAMDAAFGMEYLHLKNIVHFDLKCENLLVNMRDPQRPVCKVGDLGLSKVKHQTMVSGGVRGTLPWMAPELLNGQEALVTDKVDVYSFGIVMWELLTGEEPYASMHYGAIIGGIVNDSLRPEIPHWCEPAWRNLMERCWGADPAERPSFSDIASELRTMSAVHPKAHGQHGHGQNQGHTQGQAQGVGQGQTQAPGQAQRQVSPPRAA